MGEEVLKEGLEIINALEDKEKFPDVKDKLNLDLTPKLYEFFSKRIELILKQNEFRDQIQEALLQRINNGDIDTDQLINLFRIVLSQNTMASQSFFDIIKPVPGSENPLLKNFSDKDERETDREYLNKLSSKERQSLDKLYRLISSFEEK